MAHLKQLIYLFSVPYGDLILNTMALPWPCLKVSASTG